MIDCEADIRSGCASCQQLRDLDDKITETRALLASLLEQKGRHLTDMNTVHDKLTRRLPIELCSRIFVMSTSYSFGGEKSVGPFLLSRISKGWRSIALATPQLWAFLYIELTRKRSIEEGVCVIRDVLSRSRALPLCVTLDEESDYDESTPSDGAITIYHPILDLIRGQSSRWDKLFIRTNARFAYYLLSDQPNSSLTQLDINTDDWGCSDIDINDAGALASPSFVTVRGWEFEEIPIDWKRVTVYDGEDQRFEDLLEIIRASPCLESLEVLMQCELTPVDWASTPGVLHSTLKTLDLTFYDGEEELFAGLLFGKLTLPALDQLILNILVRRDVTLDGIDDLLRRSSCNLSRLSLHSCSGGLDIPILDLLHLLPKLKELEISDYDSNDFMVDFVDHLIESSIQTNSEAPFLPLLEKLDIGIQSTDWWIVIEDILSVFPPEVSPYADVRYRMALKHLTVWRTIPEDGWDGFILTKEAIEEVNQLRGRGFEIEFRSSGLPGDHAGYEQQDLVAYSVMVYCGWAQNDRQ